MARDYQTKANVGALPDTITATRFGAGEFNSIAVELENAVSSSDQTLAPADGTGEIATQLAMAMAIYGAGGAFYHADTGAVNAYVLTPISPKQSPPAYFDGFTVIFEAGTVNTTASTVNVNSMGVKSITYTNGNALTGGELSGSCCIKYNLSDDRFELLFASGGLASIEGVYIVDASQPDQGAASTNSETLTLFDIAALVGTSKTATCFLLHNPVAGNTTAFNFDTSLDLSAYPNLYIKMSAGARFTRTTGDELFTVYNSKNILSTGTIATVDVMRFATASQVDVETFGATPDGSTDNEPAVGLAFDALINSAGGEIVFGPGIYQFDTKITKTVLDGRDGIAISGAGDDITVLRWTAADGGIDVTLNNGSSENYECNKLLMQNFSITTTQASGGTAIAVDGGNSGGESPPAVEFKSVVARSDVSGGAYWDIGWDIDNSTKTTWLNCEYKGYTGTFAPASMTGMGIQIQTPGDHFISNFRAEFFDIGINIIGDTEGVYISNCSLVAGNYGIYFNVAAAETWLTVSNTHINTYLRGIYCRNVYSVDIKGGLITAFSSGTPTGPYIGIEGVSDLGNPNFVFNANGTTFELYDAAFDLTAISLDFVYMGSITGVNVRNTDATYTGLTGIVLTDCAQIQISDSNFYYNEIGVQIDYQCSNIGVSNCSFNNGDYGIFVSGNAASRANNITILGNQFLSVQNASLNLDSIDQCSIVGNVDSGTPSLGSWITNETNASYGSYLFSQNHWHTTAPTTYGANSTYRFGNDTGIVGRNSGVQNTADGATIAHGCFRTPKLAIAQTTVSGEFVSVGSLGATNFTAFIKLHDGTAGTTQNIYWIAEV